MRKGNIKLFHKVSIKSKFLMMILGIAVVCIAVIGFQGLNHGKTSLKKSMYDHLTSIKSARTEQIEGYFKENRSLMKTFSSEYTIIDAMNQFKAGFNLLDTYNVTIDENRSKALELFYKKEFLPKLNKNTIEEFSFTSLKPKKAVSQYLQYHYIVNNPSKVGKKDLLNQAEDKSYYSEVHNKYHLALREIIKNQGFYDLFLIDPKNGHIIYSVSKESDFATDLQNGPYAQSSLAKVVKKVINNPEKGVVTVSDFKSYKPSYNIPQAFFAVPIYDQSKFIGILATQISGKDINDITTGHQNWEKQGLGKTGEVYLVGRDYQMRSDARAIIETPEQYRTLIDETDLKEPRKKFITAIKSTVLGQKITSESVKLATEGESGTIITRNYLGKKVLSAYAPLKIEGLNWSIIAEKEIEEAEQPIKKFQNALLISSTILATLITFYAIWLAYTFLAPLTTMSRGVKNIINNKSKDKINLHRDDEFGELSDNIDKMIDTINHQKEELSLKSKENDELLLNILPQTIAVRVKNGEKNIAESVPNVAVLFSTLQGFDQLSQKMEAKESIELLNELINEFDEKAQKLGVEKITTIGDSYMAASGLITPRLDYARKLVEYAHEMFSVIELFNAKHETSLSLAIGIDSGEVMAGIVGKYKFVYDIWGEAVNDANRISHEAKIGTLRVSKAVYDQLTNQENYIACEKGSEETYSTKLSTKVS
jgi:class 3 adenylate cyclase